MAATSQIAFCFRLVATLDGMYLVVAGLGIGEDFHLQSLASLSRRTACPLMLRSGLYILVEVEQPMLRQLHDIQGGLINFRFHNVLAEDIGSNEDFLPPRRKVFVFFAEHYDTPLISYRVLR